MKKEINQEIRHFRGHAGEDTAGSKGLGGTNVAADQQSELTDRQQSYNLWQFLVPYTDAENIEITVISHLPSIPHDLFPVDNHNPKREILEKLIPTWFS